MMGRSFLFALAAIIAAIAVESRPAEAMCGGNILMTCPPAAKSASAPGGRKAASRKRAGLLGQRPGAGASKASR